MIRVAVTFHEDLFFFLPKGSSCGTIETSFHVTRSVKDLIESAGVPHVEVDCIVINGVPAQFDHLLEDGDSIHVFGPSVPSQSIDHRGETLPRLGPAPLEIPRYVADVHLKTLVRTLRMLGFDTLYNPKWEDNELAMISEREDRVLLSRDTQLLMRNNVTRGMYIRSTDPGKQVLEVIRRFHLSDRFDPLKRCISCNGEIRTITNEEAQLATIPSEIRERMDTFYRCGSCGKYYWNGTHVKRMLKRIENIRRQAASSVPR